MRKSSFERGPAVPILLDDVECTGSELSLLGCPHVDLDSENCDNTEHAGVICSNSKSVCSEPVLPYIYTDSVLAVSVFCDQFVVHTFLTLTCSTSV